MKLIPTDPQNLRSPLCEEFREHGLNGSNAFVFVYNLIRVDPQNPFNLRSPLSEEHILHGFGGLTGSILSENCIFP